MERGGGSWLNCDYNHTMDDLPAPICRCIFIAGTRRLIQSRCPNDRNFFWSANTRKAEKSREENFSFFLLFLLFSCVGFPGNKNGTNKTENDMGGKNSQTDDGGTWGNNKTTPQRSHVTSFAKAGLRPLWIKMISNTFTFAPIFISYFSCEGFGLYPPPSVPTSLPIDRTAAPVSLAVFLPDRFISFLISLSFTLHRSFFLSVLYCVSFYSCKTFFSYRRKEEKHLGAFSVY